MTSRRSFFLLLASLLSILVLHALDVHGSLLDHMRLTGRGRTGLLPLGLRDLTALS